MGLAGKKIGKYTIIYINIYINIGKNYTIPRFCSFNVIIH